MDPINLLVIFIIHDKYILTATLANLFNKIYEIEHFLEVWSEGYVIPLHKKGSVNDVENYSGITLLSTLGKLFTRIRDVGKKKYGVLIEAQAGFRAGISTPR